MPTILDEIINKNFPQNKDSFIQSSGKSKNANMALLEKDSIAFASGDFFKNASPVEDKTLLDSIEANAWVYAGIYKLATSVASVPFRIYYLLEDGSLNEITYEPEFKVFRNPNQWFTRFDFWEATTIYLEATGKCFWELVKNDQGLVYEMYALNPSRMEPIKDRKKFIIGWKYTLDSGKTITYNVEDIVFLRYFHPTNPYSGLSALKVGSTSITIDIYSQQYSLGFFKNSGRPDGLLIYDSELSDEDYDRIRRNWNKTHEGISKAHRIAIIEQGMNYKQISIPQKDMEFINQRKYSRDEILACFGVPPACVGVFESAIKANAETQERMFWTETMIPKLIKMSESVQLAIMPMILSSSETRSKYDINKIYTMFDISKVHVLSEIWRAREAYLVEHVKNGTMSRNEARIILNYIYGDIIKFLPFEGGNDIYVPSNVTQKLGTIEPTQSEEAKIFKSIDSVKLEQKIKELKALPEKERKPLKLIKQIEENIGGNINFDMNNPIAIQVLNTKPMLIVASQMNNEIIRNIITYGLAKGLGTKEIQAEIWDRFSSSSEFSLNRTNTIGRTEITQIANSSTLDSYKQSNVISKKIWLTSRDKKVRPATKFDKGDHKKLDGEEKNLNEKFSNGLMYPGEQTSRPEENINCRCTMLSKIKEGVGFKGKINKLLSDDNEIMKTILWKKYIGKISNNEIIIKNLFLQMFEEIGSKSIEKLKKFTPNKNNVDLFLIDQTEQVEEMEKLYKPLKESLYKDLGSYELKQIIGD